MTDAYQSNIDKVIHCQEMAVYSICRMTKHQGSGGSWLVSYCPNLVEFMCSRRRIEFVGLPCEHIVALLVFLDKDELPKCLLLERWTKFVKESIHGTNTEGSMFWDCQSLSRYATDMLL